MSWTRSREHAHILVVDDELSMCELLEILLGEEGYRVTSARTGKKALALLSENHFDCIICDIRLGDLTGIDVLKAAKEADDKVPVIMISAYTTTELAVEAMNCGAYDFVRSPSTMPSSNRPSFGRCSFGMRPAFRKAT